MDSANSGKSVKIVNILPLPNSTENEVEIGVEEDDFNIPCLICKKIFANEVAIKNHVRTHHFEHDAAVNDWINEAKMSYNHHDAKHTTQTLEVEPMNIMRLASQELSGKQAYRSPDSSGGSIGIQAVSKFKRRVNRRVINQRSSKNKQLSMKKRSKIIQNRAAAKLGKSKVIEDVNYILIKAGDPVEKQKRKLEVVEPGGNKRTNKNKELSSIGPFECLQSSNTTQDGVCHQIFFSCCDYSIHYRDDHTRRRKGNKCQVCEKILAPAIGEKPPESPYPCQVCGAGFNSNKDLASHTSSEHVKLKPYSCDICHKRFTQQGGVLQHKRMHTGDRPYPCTFCPKAFTQKSGLDQHLRIHTKDKPYRCVICQKSFCQSVHLTQHMRTHTNVTPFQCMICYKKFKQSSHLNYHLKNHDEANLTDDQKAKYREMLGMMRTTNASEQNDNEEVSDYERTRTREIGSQTVTGKIERDEEDEQVEIMLEGHQVFDNDHEYVINENGQIMVSFQENENGQYV